MAATASAMCLRSCGDVSASWRAIVVVNLRVDARSPLPLEKMKLAPSRFLALYSRAIVSVSQVGPPIQFS
jgi:hypothetical protein